MKKLIYIVSARDTNANLKSTLACLGVQSGLSATCGNDKLSAIMAVRNLLSEDKTVDKEFIQAFANAICDTKQPAVIIRHVNSKTISAIMCEGIVINKDMAKYIVSKNIKFANDMTGVENYITATAFSYSLEIITIQTVK